MHWRSSSLVAKWWCWDSGAGVPACDLSTVLTFRHLLVSELCPFVIKWQSSELNVFLRSVSHSSKLITPEEEEDYGDL